jgi:hypothetical protein
LLLVAVAVARTQRVVMKTMVAERVALAGIELPLHTL